MKKIILYTFLILTVFTFNACEKDDTANVSDVTNYAVFDMSGSKYTYIQIGDAYEEPGIVATENGQEIDVTVSGEVDSDTPGVYTLTYSATNSDGYSASTTRFVAVGDKDVAFNRDLSGSYSPANDVAKIADGFYSNSDILPPNGIAVVMADLGNGTLVVPPQSSPFGEVYADPNIDPATGGTLDSETSFTLSTQIGSFGVYTRTFTE